MILRFAKRGHIVGHRGLGNDNIYPITATAIEPSKVCYIDIDFFFSSLKVNHDFFFELMLFFAEELKVSERKMRNMAHMPVKGRIATALLTLRQRFGLTEAGFIDALVNNEALLNIAHEK